jgi:hypothetical protein
MSQHETVQATGRLKRVRGVVNRTLVRPASISRPRHRQAHNGMTAQLHAAPWALKTNARTRRRSLGESPAKRIIAESLAALALLLAILLVLLAPK